MTDMLNEKKYRAIYDDFLASGLTIRDYCANQNMNEAKFYYWQQKLKSQLPPKKGFVPVVFENKQQPRLCRLPAPRKNGPEVFSNSTVIDKTISCEISYPNGVSLKLNGLAGMEVLRSLLVLTQQQNV
jgi:hypothetical protein